MHGSQRDAQLNRISAYPLPGAAHSPSLVRLNFFCLPETGVSTVTPILQMHRLRLQGVREEPPGRAWQLGPPTTVVVAAGGPSWPPPATGAPDARLAPLPLRVLAELSLPHVVDSTKAELVGPCGDQALDHHGSSFRVHAGQEHRPGGICRDRGWRQRWASWGACFLLLPLPAALQPRT